MASREPISVAIVGAGAAGSDGGDPCRVGRPKDRSRSRSWPSTGPRRSGRRSWWRAAGGATSRTTRCGREDYGGSSRNAIRKVLRAYPVDAVVEFFAAEGVDAQAGGDRESCFRLTDKARTVLDALLRFGRVGREWSCVIRSAIESIDRTPEDGFRHSRVLASMRYRPIG